MITILGMKILSCEPPISYMDVVSVDTDWESREKATKSNEWAPVKISIENTEENQEIVSKQFQRQIDIRKNESEEDYKFDQEITKQIKDDDGINVNQTWLLEGAYLGHLMYTSSGINLIVKYENAVLTQEDEL